MSDASRVAAARSISVAIDVRRRRTAESISASSCRAGTPRAARSMISRAHVQARTNPSAKFLQAAFEAQAAVAQDADMGGDLFDLSEQVTGHEYRDALVGQARQDREQFG